MLKRGSSSAAGAASGAANSNRLKRGKRKRFIGLVPYEVDHSLGRRSKRRKHELPGRAVMHAARRNGFDVVRADAVAFVYGLFVEDRDATRPGNEYRAHDRQRYVLFMMLRGRDHLGGVGRIP